MTEKDCFQLGWCDYDNLSWAIRTRKTVVFTLEALVLDELLLPVNDPQNAFSIALDNVSCLEPAVRRECLAISIWISKISSVIDYLVIHGRCIAMSSVLHNVGSMQPQLSGFTFWDVQPVVVDNFTCHIRQKRPDASLVLRQHFMGGNGYDPTCVRCVSEVATRKSRLRHSLVSVSPYPAPVSR